MANEIVLIVEDEHDILNLITYSLRKEGFLTRTASSGEEALGAIAEERPDIVVLDLMLPGIDGFEVCRRIRANEGTKTVPVIMLTAKSEDTDIVVGLELGADDYVTKPFSPKVLVSRIRAVLRRSTDVAEVSATKNTSIHGIEIDELRHEVTCDGEPVMLSASEFRILVYLAMNPGRVFSRSQIISGVKGDDYPVTERSVDVQIVGLRRKLAGNGKHIVTVRGIGYKMEEEKGRR